MAARNGHDPAGFGPRFGVNGQSGPRPLPASAPVPAALPPTDGGSAAVDRILRERARLLAQTPPQEGAAVETPMLLFRLGAEQYAVELALLRAVQPSDGITAVPGAPSSIAGILNVRGEIVTVLDLATALNLRPAAPPAPNTTVVLAEAPQGRVGLLVDEVLGVRPLALETLDRPFSGRDFARGIAGASIIVLDLLQLLSDGRFEVLDDI
ncbi:MAG: chemotaxis protein CheW [Chloroflexi bacterium]|nr:chemotaxis protein CheW [Chloroflexota bacterium]